MKPFTLPLSLLLLFLSVLAPDLLAQEQDTIPIVTADTIRANTLWLEMNQDITSGAYSEEALKKGVEAKQLYIKHFGLNNCSVGYLARQIGLLLLQQNRPTDAIDTLEHALEAYGSLKCGARPQHATVYYHMAVALVNIGAFKEASKAGEKALALELKYYGGPNEVDIAMSYNTLGEVYSLMGNVEKALYYNQLAEGIYVELAPSDNEGLGTVYYNRGVTYMRAGDMAASMELMMKARSMMSSASVNNLMNDGDILGAMALLDVNNGQFESAVYKGLRAIKILSGPNQGNLMKIALVHNTVASAYKKQGKYALAKQHYEDAEKVILKLPLKKKYYLHYIYNNLAELYITMSDFKKGEEYLKFALANCGHTEQKNEAIISNIRGNLIQLYQMTGNFLEAQALLEEEFGDRSERLVERNVNLASVYMALGHNQFNLENYDEALGYFRRGLHLYSSRLEPDAANFHSAIAEMNIRLQAHETALLNLDSALMISKEFHEEGHPEILKIRRARIVPLTFLGRFKEVSTELENCLKGIHYQEEQDYDQIEFRYIFLDILSTAGWYYQKKYLSQKQKEDLVKSEKYFLAYIKAMDHYLKTVDRFDKRDNLSYSAHISDFCALTTKRLLFVETGDQNYLKQGYTYVERSKASSLGVALQNVKAVAGLPDALSLAERRFRSDIGELEKELIMEQSNSDFDSDALYKDLKGQRKEYLSFIQYLGKNYPKYYQAKYGFRTVTMEEVQQELLKDEETLLEFQVGEDSLILYLIQKNHFEVRQVLNAPIIKKWVEAIQAGKTDFYSQEEAYSLYELLLKPVEHRLTKKLIIIPDGTLGYIPFELLLTELPENRFNHSHSHYLIEDKEISYCYSATLLKEMRDKEHLEATKGELLALAPFAPSDTFQLENKGGWRSAGGEEERLTVLPASRSEVESVRAICKGDAFYGRRAHLDRFKELAGKYRMLLLATHGVVDDRRGDFSYLAFTHPDSSELYQKLYVHDLYNYTLNADLVVLSACKTGVGYYQRGEGLISLARAVSYSGGKSVFTTLWSVDDEASKELIISFFKYLQSDKRLSKSEALRQAKLDYIRSHKKKENKKMANPIYWAGFIGIGDMSPIVGKK